MIEPGCFGLDQPARHRLRDEIGGAHVEAHDRVEVLDRDVHQQLRPVGAGIVDQDVERLRRADRRLHGGEVGDVEHQRSALSPRARIASAAASISACVRAASVTCAPACASADAAASPMPRPPPVTSARLPSRRKEGVLVRSMVIGHAPLATNAGAVPSPLVGEGWGGGWLVGYRSRSTCGLHPQPLPHRQGVHARPRRAKGEGSPPSLPQHHHSAACA